MRTAITSSMGPMSWSVVSRSLHGQGKVSQTITRKKRTVSRGPPQTYRRVIVRFWTAVCGRIRVCRVSGARERMLTGKVQCHTKWCPQFVVAGVAFANRGIGIIDTGEDTSFSQFGGWRLQSALRVLCKEKFSRTNFLDEGIKFFLGT